MARAFFFDRRSSISSWIESRRPNRMWRMLSINRPVGVRGIDAVSRATRVPGPE
ncbi:MAG TPA: hypothetical protein VIK08_11645 [Candidatus Limnocylindrales bacterium]